MAKNSIDAYGAEGKTNLLLFDPEKLKIVTDPAHPLFDERVNLPLDEPMVLNILHCGVIEPIVVSKNTETGETEVVAGRQRVKHCIEANRRLRERGCEPHQVPAVIRRASSVDLAGVMVSENELRRDDTPLGRAEKMRRLQAFGRSDDQLSIIFGCTVTTVRSTLALLDCSAAVRKAVEGGKINVGHALKLSKLEPAVQREKLAELVNAADTLKGHERAQAQRRVVAVDLNAVKPRSRKDIEAALGAVKQPMVAATLAWVLGQTEVLPA